MQNITRIDVKEKYYKMMVRTRGEEIPVIIRQSLIEDMDYVGWNVSISGSYRSRRKKQEKITRTLLYVLAEKPISTVCEREKNKVYITGTVISVDKNPNREKVNLVLRVTRQTGLTDIIPCVGRYDVARELKEEDVKVGDILTIRGRIHRREYQQKNEQVREVYEVCLLKVEYQ